MFKVIMFFNTGNYLELNTHQANTTPLNYLIRTVLLSLRECPSHRVAWAGPPLTWQSRQAFNLQAFRFSLYHQTWLTEKLPFTACIYKGQKVGKKTIGRQVINKSCAISTQWNVLPPQRKTNTSYNLNQYANEK